MAVREQGDRVVVPAGAVEFVVGGNTIWVQGAGGTILRIKTMGRIQVTRCKDNLCSHADVMVREDITVCLSGDAE